MDSLSVNVLVSQGSLSNFDQVVAACEAVGLRVSQRLPTIGVIVGDIAADAIEALERVQGVKFVERNQSIQLPPPDSDIQ